ncbi:S41 family peptidase [Kribbella qitaiheensis]|uniref:S41 family peptidase n=1 Tax=Kribbella qitaiheensis TaxID=1544730 RepID=A0A7G6X2E4_9ACTN|nr:S41 family peptidase [Kribbella qitaiheensis]QNE20409.1 S41 family peptidase [Kribbella qitaiheensis]
MDSQTFRPARRLLIGVGLAAGLVAAPLSAPLAATAAITIDGVWQTEGYGLILAVDNGKAQLYPTTSISCTTPTAYEQDGNRFTAEGEQAFTVKVTRDRGLLHVEGDVGDKHLRRLAKLPSTCTAPAPTGPLAVFDQFWTDYAENYPFFRAKGIDWRAVRTKYRPQVKPGMPDDALFELLASMIRPLGDAHTAIRSPDEKFEYGGVRPGTTFPSEELEAKLRPYIESTALKGSTYTSYANDRIGYADLPGRIGYLRVIAFLGYGNIPDYNAERKTLNQALDQALAGAANLRGLILDLRINGGGSDQLALDVAARLTDKPFFAYFKRARNDPRDASSFTTPQPLFVQPGQGPRYAGPMVILTGGSQMSAGETFTQAMMNRSPRPVRVGQNTQGVFSDTLQRTLPNGWDYILPNEEFRTLDWKAFDGPGIPPDVRRPVFTPAEFAAGRDSAFATALALLKRK